MLPHNVARFIDEQNVTNVVVVGGTACGARRDRDCD